MMEFIATLSALIVVLVSVFASVLYSLRIRGHEHDIFRWKVLGWTGTLALTNFPVLFALADARLPLWIGATARIVAAIILLAMVKPMIVTTLGDIRESRQHRRDVAEFKSMHHVPDDHEDS